MMAPTAARAETLSLKNHMDGGMMKTGTRAMRVAAMPALQASSGSNGFGPRGPGQVYHSVSTVNPPSRAWTMMVPTSSVRRISAPAASQAWRASAEGWP